MAFESLDPIEVDLNQSGDDLCSGHAAYSGEGILNLLDLGEGVRQDTTAGIPGRIRARSKAPGIHEGDSSGDECFEVPIERGNCLLNEVTDAARVLLELLVDRIGHRAGHEAAGAFDEGICQSREVATEHEVSNGRRRDGCSCPIGLLLAGFLGVGGGHQGSLNDGSSEGFPMLAVESETFKRQDMRRIINNR